MLLINTLARLIVEKQIPTLPMTEHQNISRVFNFFKETDGDNIASFLRSMHHYARGVSVGNFHKTLVSSKTEQ